MRPEPIRGSESEDDLTPRGPGKKDRRAWCRGKVGRPHQLVIDVPVNSWAGKRPCGWKQTGWLDDQPVTYFCKHAELCSVCGRIFREHFGFLKDSPLKDEECPDYQPRP